MKKQLMIIVALAVASGMTAAQADVEITANGGAVTQYIFRGVPQSEGKAAAQGGLDLTASGFYVGTWISQVDTSARTADGEVPASGLEYDLYAGYAIDVSDDFWEIGYGKTLTVADKDLFDYSFAIIRSDKDLSFKVDGNGNPTEDTFFYAGVVKTFDLFSN